MTTVLRQRAGGRASWRRLVPAAPASYLMLASDSFSRDGVLTSSPADLHEGGAYSTWVGGAQWLVRASDGKAYRTDNGTHAVSIDTAQTTNWRISATATPSPGDTTLGLVAMDTAAASSPVNALSARIGGNGVVSVYKWVAGTATLLGSVNGVGVGQVHLAMEREGDSLRVYVNNVLAGTYDVTGVPTTLRFHGIRATGLAGTETVDLFRSSRLPVTVTSDAFTRTGELDGSSSDAALGGSALTWAVLTTGEFQTTGGTLRRNNMLAVGSQLPTTFTDGEVHVQAAALVSGGPVAVVMRQDTNISNNHNYRALFASSGGTVQLGKAVAGITTTLGSSFSYAVGDRVGVRCIGTTISLLINGEVMHSVTDTDVDGSAGARVGVRKGNSSTFQFDDLKAVSL